MILYELLNFEGSYQAEANEIRANLRLASMNGARWIEWSPAMVGIVDKPDVSIVSSRNMFPKTLRKIIQSSYGTLKVAYGPPLYGFDCVFVDKGFIARDLESIFFDADIKEVEPEDVFRVNIWQKTIPMPLPIGRQS